MSCDTSLSGNVANYLNAGVSAKIDLRFAGTNHTVAFSANTDRLVDQLANELADAVTGF